MPITLGNNSVIHATGQGTIHGLICIDGQDQQLELHDVLLVPALAKNLVSPNWLTKVSFVTIQDQ
jgi:hypothetical protein